MGRLQLVSTELFWFAVLCASADVSILGFVSVIQAVLRINCPQSLAHALAVEFAETSPVLVCITTAKAYARVPWSGSISLKVLGSCMVLRCEFHN